MANPISSLEFHPMRQKVIDARLAGQTFKQIAAWLQPPKSEAAICRFFQACAEMTDRAISQANRAIANIDNTLPDSDGLARQAVMKATCAVAIDPFISRVHELRRDRQSVKDACLQATETPDLATWAKLDGNDLKELELHARLAGRLDQAGAQVNVQIVIPATVEPRATPIDYASDDVLTIDIGSK